MDGNGVGVGNIGKSALCFFKEMFEEDFSLIQTDLSLKD